MTILGLISKHLREVDNAAQTSQQHTSHQPIPQQHTPQQHTPQQHSPQQYTSQQYTPQQYTPQQYTLQHHTPQQHSPQQYTPQHHTPQQYTLLHHIQQLFTPQQYTPQQYTPQRYTPQQYTLQQHTRQQYSLYQQTPQQYTLQQYTPQQQTSQQHIPSTHKSPSIISISSSSSSFLNSSSSSSDSNSPTLKSQLTQQSADLWKPYLDNTPIASTSLNTANFLTQSSKLNPSEQSTTTPFGTLLKQHCPYESLLPEYSIEMKEETLMLLSAKYKEVMVLRKQLIETIDADGNNLYVQATQTDADIMTKTIIDNMYNIT